MRYYTVSKLGRNTSLNRLIRNTIQCIDQYVEEDNIAKCASAVVRNTIQWEKNFTISLANEKDLHNLFGHRSSVPRSLESDFRWTTRSLFYQLKRALFFMRTQPMAAARSHTRLSPLDANKSRNSDAPSTRGFRVCRWNLISAAFVTKHTAMLFFFIPFPIRSPHPSLFILRARFSIRSRRYQPRETRSLLKIRNRIERDGTALQIELNSCITFTSLLLGCIACQFRILWSQITTPTCSRE